MAKAGPMPTHQGLRSDDRDGPEHRWKPSIQQDQEQAITICEPDATPHPALQHNQLMTERRVLGLKSALRLERRDGQGQEEAEEPPGGQFVLHARALPGNPYDGHTLGAVIEATERLTGRAIERAYVDKGYRGHHTPNPRRVFMSGQKRGVFGRIKRELRRRSAIEAVIGHMKAEGHLGRCYLKGRAGDAANVILSAVGYNLRLVLAWLRTILRVVLLALFQTFAIRLASNRLVNGRLLPAEMPPHR